MNKVFLVGNLAADPIVKNTQSGTIIVNLTVATSDQKSRSETYFFPCVAFNQQAKFIGDYLKKGDMVSIDGRLTRRSYVSKEGKNVYVTEIIIETIKSHGRKQNQENNFASVNQSFENKINSSEGEIYRANNTNNDTNNEDEDLS